MADDADRVHQVIESQEGVGEHKNRLRQAQYVVIWRGQTLEVAYGLVRQESDGAAVEPLVRRLTHHLYVGHGLLHRDEGIDIAMALARSRPDDIIWLGAYEGVPSHAAATFDALKKERIGALRYLQICANGGFQIRINIAVHRHQVTLF